MPSPVLLDALFAGVLGLLVGSFLNVVIYRLPKIMERFDLQAFQITGKHTFFVAAFAKSGLIEGANGQKL